MITSKVGPDKFSPAQWAFIKCRARFKMWRASRRIGKTNAAEFDHIKYALTHEGTTNWYVAQDLALCTEMNIPLFRDMVPESLITSYSKQERKYRLASKSDFYFKTANSSDSLRGRKVHRLTCEEPTYWQNGSDIYHNILRPQLADTMGSCSIIFTPPTMKAPKGSEWVRRLEQAWAEEVKRGNPDYAVFHNTIWDSPYIQEQEKKNLQTMTDAETWQCEYMAEYNDKIGQVYWEFDPLTKKGLLPAQDNVIMRVRGLDFGISDNTACSWVCLLPGNRVYIEAEYIANNLDVPTHANAIKGRNLPPAQYTVLDSSCWARDASLTSVAKRFAAEGIACTQGTKDLDGSVSDMKRMFSAGNILVNPNCTGLLQAIDSWQHGQHEPDILAATRYGIDALIRTGKLLPPMRKVAVTMTDHIQQFNDLEKRMTRLNAGLESKERGRGGMSFKVI